MKQSVRYIACLIALIFCAVESAYSQQAGEGEVSKTDSILNLVAKTGDEMEKARLYNAIVHLGTTSSEDRIKYSKLSLEHCHKDSFRLIADNNNYISYSYNQLAKPKESIGYSRKLIGMYEKLGRRDRVGVMYGRMAESYKYLQKSDSIFHYYNQALRVYEELKDTANISETLFGLGSAYSDFSFYKSGEEYFRKALAIDSARHGEKEIARDYYGIAHSVSEGFYKNLSRGIMELRKAADIFDRTHIDENDIQYIIYKNISYTYLAHSYIMYAKEGGAEYADSCKQYLDKVGTFFDDIGFEGLAAVTRLAYVRYLIYNGKYNEALPIMLELEAHLNNGEMSVETFTFYDALYELYEKKKDYKNACIALRKRYERELAMINDSALASAANAKTEMALYYERKITDAEKARMEVERDRMYVVICSLVGGLVLVSLLVFYILRALRIRKKANRELSVKNTILADQKEEIEAQRDTIQRQRDEIQAGINYAQLIQRMLLTPSETISSIFPEHFLLYKPRNTVSGDFYWVGQSGDNKVCIVADSTGHGVPGAFLSVLGMSNLNYIVGQTTRPEEILNQLREAIIKNLRQRDETPAEWEEMTIGEDTDLCHDGMDVAAYVVNEKTMTLSYAGANNPLVLIRDGGIQLLKADRMPVGVYASHEPFKSTTVSLQEGDCIYTFSDGYQDQFGYRTGKKFMSKQLRELLLEIYRRPMDEQKSILNKTFEEWRGPVENQTDDVVVMGVRIGKGRC
ncbi:MAG: SpoIIE family protein phosphatase [Bacteroidales bacterium]|nr:SpoIIE family protein phosphatase [Bacteroidales bacterium]